jgi:valyl-tRNA synthetase
MDLSTKFDFKAVEDKWIKYWQDNNLFHADAKSGKPPYTVVIPPPNVTGILHMGHALNNTLQDIIIRYKRMSGCEALWMPGTDHAGIATQNVVEKELAKEGKKRQDIGREEFVKKLWEWKNQYGDTIIHQLKKIGSSCDWPRTRFTMDDAYSEAVKYTFVKLHEKGLIYQGEYIINWCPRCQTALSDEEAEHEEVQGSLYHFRYPLKDDPKKYVVVATTRPETMLGDTAVAVNPKDGRYKDLIGKTLVLPLINREIKIIADDFVDKDFGTGAVKVTPAHDPNDFQMGRRHKLEFINVMHPDGRINEKGGNFKDLDRFKARKAVVAALEELGLVEKIDKHMHAVGHCYRCHTVVEPYLSKQWFVKMKELAKPAYEAVNGGTIKFYPDRWTKVYLNWMHEDNIRDWCISRQIWWGHRIPVWYCEHSDHKPIVSMNAPEACPQCGSKKLRQDEDVLDTWFSSWLWPFATLGWPKDNPDLKYFYPTASLFTASEIIFFWVARMIMAGLFFMKEVPFTNVYIHGTVRDVKGRKMSKSLGNALDPLEIINEYGADALRFSLIINSGQDIFISKEKFEIGRNFANKVWNATRLVLMNVKDIDPNFDLSQIPKDKLDLPSRWIISQFYATLRKTSVAIESFRFSDAETHVQDFFWGNFCDWYLEIIKDRWADKNIQNIAYKILEESLKMISPFMPFVTEEIWSHISKDKGAICVSAWPKGGQEETDVLDQMQTLIDMVGVIRNVRTQWNIKANDKVQIICASSNKKDRALLQDNAAILKSLGKISEISVEDTIASNKNAATGIVGSIKFIIPLGDLIDLEKEKQRILKQIEENKKFISSIDGRLNNEDFVSKAPPDVIAKDREKREGLVHKTKELEAAAESLS